MLVICDINIYKQGHYIGYNQYLLDHADKIKEVSGINEFLFLFNEEGKEYLSVQSGVRVDYISFPPQWRSSPWGRWKIWRRILLKLGRMPVEQLYFMDFDKFQLPVGLSKTPFRISGIYFRPHHRISIYTDSGKQPLTTRIKRFKKILAEKLLLNNTAIEKVFILNDSEGVSFLNSYHGKNVFRYLPDPIFDYPFKANQFQRSTEEMHLLLFGALTERKNIRLVLEAFGLANFQKKAVLHLVGKTESEGYLNTLQKLATDHITGQEHKKNILFNTRFVSDEEMEKYHAQTDISILVYRNFFGSSGLIGRAAKHRQYVLAPSVGLLASITEQYNLGLTVDPLNVKAIAESMEQAEREINTHNYEGAARFYREHHPSEFLSTLFSSDF
ncbi:MAG: glycosyltransferase [Flavihumibacter sp.]|jgi:glycosyltransferase involved in cell wall biosynthesis|nr:glycosyltransferase [Flavihumibacter sp.]